jgi:hypothetical protein
MWKTLVTRGSAAPGSDDEPASLSWPAVGAGLETATPDSFIEPTTLAGRLLLLAPRRQPLASAMVP